MTLRSPTLAHALRSDRGTTTLATVITFPVVMLLLGACFQTAFWFAARNTALAAAQQGADTARAAGATVAQGETAACEFAATAGHGMLTAAACTGTGGATVTITVCGNTPRLLPLLPLPARACEQAQGPQERFTTP